MFLNEVTLFWPNPWFKALKDISSKHGGKVLLTQGALLLKIKAAIRSISLFASTYPI